MSIYKKGELIGSGDHGDVYDIDEGPFAQKNVAKEGIVDYNELELKTEKYAKAGFYFTKILHALFPDEIPNIRMSALDDDYNLIEIREKKNLVGAHKAYMDDVIGKTTIDYETHHALLDEIESMLDDSDLLKKMKELGIEIDNSALNFAKDDKGRIIYVDSLEPWIPSGVTTRLNFDVVALEKKIREQFKNDDSTRERLLRYLERIGELFEEEQLFDEEEQ